MPLFSWMKWSHRAEEQMKDEGPRLKPPGAAAGHMLLRELLWHVEEREHLARQLGLEQEQQQEQQQQQQQRAYGALGLQWFQKHPGLRTPLPASELLQLECLCARVPPIHAAAVLSRFREALATNHILYREPVYVFKQVLGDFLSEEELEEQEHSGPQAKLRPMEAWTNHYQMKHGFITPTMLKCIEHPRDEIPTISGYVDRAMRHSGYFAAYRDWDLPFHCPVPIRATEGYSTTI